MRSHPLDRWKRNSTGLFTRLVADSPVVYGRLRVECGLLAEVTCNSMADVESILASVANYSLKKRILYAMLPSSYHQRTKPNGETLRG